MNIIQIILLVGIWILAITKGISFVNLRDEYIKSNATEKPQELKSTQKAFISSLVCAIVYTIAKLGV